MRKNWLVVICVWIAVQIIDVAAWIGAAMLMEYLDLSPGTARLVATGVALPVIALVNLIMYYWAFSEYGGVVMWGLVGGLLIVLILNITQGVPQSLLFWTATEEYGLDRMTVSALSLLGQIIFVIGAPLFDLLSDRVGRRSLVAGGVLLTAAAVAALSIAKNTILLGLAQAGIGLGLAMLLPSLIVCLLEAVWSRRLYATVTGFYLGTAALGQFIGIIGAQPAGAAWFNDKHSGLFVVAGLTLLVGGAVGMGGLGLSYVLDRSRPRSEERIATPPNRFWVWSLVLIGLVVLFAGWAIAIQRSWLVSDERWPETERTLLYIFIAGGMLATMLAQFLSGLLADFCDWLATRFTRRSWGRTLVLALGALVMCVGTTLYLTSQKAAVAGVALIITGAGYGMLGPSLIALVCANVPHPRWGLGIGLYLTIGVLAGLLSGYVTGQLADSLGMQSVFTSALVTAGLSLLVALALLVFQLRGDGDRLECVSVEQ